LITNKLQLLDLFVLNQLYMFRTMFSPIIRSNWLYLHLLILSTDIAAGRQQRRWTVSEAVNTVVLLMMGENIARNM